MAKAFVGVASGTIGIAASVASAALPIAVGKSDKVSVHNPTTGVAFVRFGAGSAPTATAADFPVPAGGTRTIAIPPGTTHVAVILSAGTGTVYVTTGSGD